ncbi:MAG: RNA methyltransferase [Chitinophagaceae bacterium]
MDKLSMDDLNRKTITEFKSAEKFPVIVVLDNVRSMHNVGSVFRTADGFLLQAIYLCGYTPKPPHRDIQKTALGATETVQWEAFETTMEAIKRLRQDGYKLLAVEQATQSIMLPQINYSANEKLAIIFGNEVDGVEQDVIDRCDACIEIPQFGMKHSLNVSVAAGIVLYKIIERQLK